tara:strand:- start:592 stop:894 length:303 start_codon:yes stop_codon:yes gene_type:complete
MSEKKNCAGLPGCWESHGDDDKLSLMDRAKSFIKTTGEYVASGVKNLSDEDYKKRMKICESCAHLIKDKNVCNKCGCYLPIKGRWEISKCPIGKWEKLKE